MEGNRGDEGGRLRAEGMGVHSRHVLINVLKCQD